MQYTQDTQYNTQNICWENAEYAEYANKHAQNTQINTHKIIIKYT